MLLCFSTFHFVWPMPLAGPALAGRREGLELIRPELAAGVEKSRRERS
jgi:hypothetical protein